MFVEFAKKIPIKKSETEKEEIKDFTFASVFEGKDNLAAYMLGEGLISFQQIRTEEDVSKFLEEMKASEERGKKERKGLYKSEHIKIPSYNDVSGGKGKKLDAGRSKTLFEFLKD